MKGDLDNAIRVYLDALQGYKELGDKEGEAMVDGNLGTIFRDRDDYPQALKYTNEGLRIFREIGAENEVATALMNVGVIYSMQNDYPRALEYLFKSMRMMENKPECKRDLGRVLLNIATVYIDQGDYAKTLDYSIRALAIAESTGNRNSQVICLDNIASVYLRQNDPAKALDYNFKALKIAEETEDNDGIANLLLNIGTAYNLQKNYSLAIAYCLRSAVVNKPLGSRHRAAWTLMTLGECYLNAAEDDNAGKGTMSISSEQPVNKVPIVSIPQSRSAKLELAIQYLKEALDSSKPINGLDIMKNCYNKLAAAYSLSGKPELALASYKDYIVIHDSIFNKEKNNEITRHELQYEYSRREDSIRFKAQTDLQAKNYKIRQQKVVFYTSLGALVIIVVLIVLLQRSRIKRARTEQQALFARQLLEIELKALRAQMNPHFIFNCLNSIQAFILKENKVEAADYLQKFSKLIRMILDSSQKTSNTIEDEAEILGLYIDLEQLRLKNSFDYEIIVSDELDPTFTEVPSMVLQPIVENSIWHGLMRAANKGFLKVEFRKLENKLICIVADNGIGRQKSKELNALQRKGHESKGMKLIEDRLKAWSQTKGLHCTFNVYDNEANGSGTRTEITILYPVHA
jgi:tetratricopeptide (TPR) repeat protein